MSSFAGKVAVVTGGARGIGRATAWRLAQRGATVWVGDYDCRVDDEPAWHAAGIRLVSCDVRHSDQLAQLLRQAGTAAGRLDLLVNNAGVGLVKPLEAVSVAEWDDCLNTNLRAAFFGIQQALPWFQAAGGGVVVNVSSNAGLLPRAHDPVYSLSKAALVALTKGLALCLAERRVRVNAVCPGPVDDTGMIAENLAAAADPVAARQQLIAASPLAAAWGRMIEPWEVAEAICYLASDEARLVTGAILAIDGGKSLGVPRTN